MPRTGYTKLFNDNMAYKRSRSTSAYGSLRKRRRTSTNQVVRRMRRTRAGRGLVGPKYQRYAPGRVTATAYPSSEIHAVEGSSASQLISSVPNYINDISVGSGIADRQGQSVRMHNLELNFRIFNNQQHASDAFVAVVYDRRPDGGLPLLSQIFTEHEGLLMQQFSHRDRFDILWQKHYDLEGDVAASGAVTSPTTTSIQQESIVVPIYRNAKWNINPDGILANCKFGALYVLFSSTGPFLTPLRSYHYRVTFSP